MNQPIIDVANVPTLAEVHAFLLGEGTLDGLGYGQANPNIPGKWWWRRFLRAAIASHLEGGMVPADADKGGSVLCPTAPKVIWLQVDPECLSSEPPVYTSSDVTWCEDRINKSDTKYIRADLARVPADSAVPGKFSPTGSLAYEGHPPMSVICRNCKQCYGDHHGWNCPPLESRVGGK